MENRKSMVFAMMRGMLGYTSLIGLGLVTNIFSEELATEFAKFIMPMALFLAGAALVELTTDTVGSLIGRWRRGSEAKESVKTI